MTNTLRAEGENASEYAYGNKWYGNAEWTSGDLTVSFDYTLTALENNHLQVDATIEGLDKVPGLAVLQMQIGVGGWTNAVKNEDGSYTWVSLDNPTFELGNDVAPLHFYFPYESGGVVNQAIDGYKFGAANEKPVKEILPKLTAKAQNITANSAEIAYEVTLPEELTGATVKVYLNDAEVTASPITLADLTPSTDYSYTMKAVATKDGQDYTGKEVKVEFKTNRDATAAKIWYTIKDGFINNVPVSIETAIAYNPNSTVTITAIPHCAKAIEGLVWKACACLVGGDRIMDMTLADGKYTYTTEAAFEENVGLYVYYFAAFAGGDARLDINGYQTGLENDAVAYGEPASIEMSGVPATMIVNESYNVSSIVKDNNGHYLVEKAADCVVEAPFTLVDGVLTATAKVTDIINLSAGIYVAGGRKYIVR